MSGARRDRSTSSKENDFTEISELISGVQRGNNLEAV
jgi:hypothetical protein